MDQTDQAAKLAEAFSLMWANFPEPAMLIHKSKTILALNEAASSLGLKAGSVCALNGQPESHAGCLALKSLLENKAMYSVQTIGGRKSIAYWLPVSGQADYYVHLAVGSTINYE